MLDNNWLRRKSNMEQYKGRNNNNLYNVLTLKCLLDWCRDFRMAPEAMCMYNISFDNKWFIKPDVWR